eukprot:8706593-Pyramimonas_sp.AAC.1
MSDVCTRPIKARGEPTHCKRMPRASLISSIGDDSPTVQSIPRASPPCTQAVPLPVDAVRRAGAERRSRGSASRPSAGCPG